jgi:vacuolar-type H+-ATPase subunit H
MNPNLADLSPLDRIRLVEGEVARQLVAAREKAEESMRNVRVQAERMRVEACEAGGREGEVQYKSIIANAEEEAQAIVAQARCRSNELKRRGQQRMEQIILVAINIVTGWEGEARLDEH